MDRFAGRFGNTDMRHPFHLPNTRRVLAAAELARDRGRLDAFREPAETLAAAVERAGAPPT
jgi:hypothetical protein